MQLREIGILATVLDERDCSYARLGRRVGRSRQFIQRLATGQVPGCSTELATAIEEALAVDEGTLFMPSSPHAMGVNTAGQVDKAAYA